MAGDNSRDHRGLVASTPILPRVVQFVGPCGLHPARDRDVGEPHLSEYLVGYGQLVCCIRTMVVMEVKRYTCLRPIHCYDVSSPYPCWRNCRCPPNSQ